MADCPLADDCPEFQERIEGMGCDHYGNRGGAEWCQHYSQPIRELKTAPVKLGEEVVVEVNDIHESGAGVGRTDDGFIVMVDGILPEARAKVKITNVMSNHARAEEIERLPMEEEAEEDETSPEEPTSEADDSSDDSDGSAKRQRLGSRDNFWGS